MKFSKIIRRVSISKKQICIKIWFTDEIVNQKINQYFVVGKYFSKFLCKLTISKNVLQFCWCVTKKWAKTVIEIRKRQNHDHPQKFVHISDFFFFYKIKTLKINYLSFITTEQDIWIRRHLFFAVTTAYICHI